MCFVSITYSLYAWLLFEDKSALSVARHDLLSLELHQSGTQLCLDPAPVNDTEMGLGMYAWNKTGPVAVIGTGL